MDYYISRTRIDSPINVRTDPDILINQQLPAVATNITHEETKINWETYSHDRDLKQFVLRNRPDIEASEQAFRPDANIQVTQLYGNLLFAANGQGVGSVSLSYNGDNVRYIHSRLGRLFEMIDSIEPAERESIHFKLGTSSNVPISEINIIDQIPESMLVVHEKHEGEPATAKVNEGQITFDMNASGWVTASNNIDFERIRHKVMESLIPELSD